MTEYTIEARCRGTIMYRVFGAASKAEALREVRRLIAGERDDQIDSHGQPIGIGIEESEAFDTYPVPSSLRVTEVWEFDTS